MRVIKLPIDHVGIVGSDLDRMLESFSKLGFYLSGRTEMTAGVEGQGASTNAHFVFDQGYIETIASTGSDHLADYLARGEGLHIAALRSGDARKSREELEQRGLKPGAVLSAARPARHGSVQGQASFDWFGFDPSSFPEGLVCVVEHKTPELIFQPETRYVHPNGAKGIVDLFVYTAGEEGAAPYESLAAGVPAMPLAAGHTPEWTEQLTLLVSPSEVRDRFPFLGEVSEPRFLGVLIEVASLQVVKDLLDEAAVAYHGDGGGDGDRDRDGRRDGRRTIWVHPNDAAGCMVGFTERL
ncbi:VOC family protein [Paenibacillus sp. GCM10023252]|uniref:VOC family protein n=1 Tax=Paenibacillus sp. GCM10023252 TaxID=3252649 RepID=UPI00361FF60D